MFEDEMSEETASPEREEGLDEFEIDADVDVEAEGSLDQAMRDALDAVEQIASQVEESEDGDEEDLTEAMADIEAAVKAGGTDGEEAEISVLRAEISDLRDRSVRTLADFDNYRKRVERERDDLRRYAAIELLRDFLGVMDNLERAVGSEGSVDDLKQGVQMILRQMGELLRGQGVRQVEADGVRFDPAVHEAVSQVGSDDVQVPSVDSVLQQGYVIHERLLRPAMVVVAMPTEPAPNAEADSSDGELGDEG